MTPRRTADVDGPAVVQALIDPDENIQPPGLLEFTEMYEANEMSHETVVVRK